jgi:hypothetical protein
MLAMARAYTFQELHDVTHALAGTSRNANKNLVQTGTIRADVKATSGTGDPRRFGFLDVFEAIVAGKLMQIPGGMPTAALSVALAALRAETEMGEIWGSPWGTFLNPATRDPDARFWLCRCADGVARVLDSPAMIALLNDDPGVLVTVRLDSLLIALEQATQDHASPQERGHAWLKQTVPPQIESAQALIEAAIRRELEQAGQSFVQIELVLSQLREQLLTLRPELRAAAALSRFVEMVDAIVTITGPGPNYAQWRKDVAAFLASWKRKKRAAPTVGDRIIELLAARGASARPPQGKDVH